MIFIFTLDNSNGTQFCGKRQSKDKIVAGHILNYANGKPVYMKEKSTSFFENTDKLIHIDNFENLENDAICFAEEVVSAKLLEKAEYIIVYRWNRSYPSIVKDRLDLSGYTKRTVEEFAGNSHEKITVEIYSK